MPRPCARADLKASEIRVGPRSFLSYGVLRSILFGQSNVDLAFGQETLAPVVYRCIQGRSNGLMIAVVILHDLTMAIRANSGSRRPMMVRLMGRCYRQEPRTHVVSSYPPALVSP